MESENLMAHFKFDDADLQANRGGQFSEKQKQRLAALGRSSRWGRSFSGVVFISFGLAGFIGAIMVSASNQLLFVKIMIGLIFGLIWPLILGALGVYSLRKSKATFRYKLHRAQGLAHYSRHINTDTRRPVYGYQLLHIGTKIFDVGEDAPNFILAGSEYQVYYYNSQSVSTILSAELIATPA